MANVIEIWRNGTGIDIDFTNYLISNTGVISFQGNSGAINLIEGNGISISGLTIENSGVLSFQGSVGDITLIQGSGISISGLTLTNSGVLSITAGSGINASAETGAITVANTGVLSFQSLTGDIALTAGSGVSISSLTINVIVDNTYILINDSNNITINLAQNYAWTGIHTFTAESVFIHPTGTTMPTIPAGTFALTGISNESILAFNTSTVTFYFDNFGTLKPLLSLVATQDTANGEHYSMINLASSTFFGGNFFTTLTTTATSWTILTQMGMIYESGATSGISNGTNLKCMVMVNTAGALTTDGVQLNSYNHITTFILTENQTISNDNSSTYFWICA